MADIRGYEEREPRVLEALKSGYPRFVVHAFIAELIAWYLQREGQAGRSDATESSSVLQARHLPFGGEDSENETCAAVLIPGRRATQALVDYVGPGVTASRVEEALFLVHFDGDDRDLNHRVRKFVQHTGCGISSRQAEDLLVTHGLRESPHPEATAGVNPQLAVEAELARLIGCATKDVLVCASGMNAFYAGFRAVQEAQSAKGRRKWLQLGWLYLDSGCVLKEFLHENETLDCCYDATDTDVLIRKIEDYGQDLAGVVIECPTNPLVQVADLGRIASAVRRSGGMLMIDPTIASVYNVNVLSYADILVTSLTKYASCEGDVMIGAVALNPDSPHYGDLVLRTSSYYQPPYVRDLARLAYQMQRAPEVVALMNSNTRKLVDFLRAHPVVKKVHYAGDSEQFGEIIKGADSGGALITLELNGDIEPVYDALQVMKGPSFGTEFTLVCPFMYLAHYDLVTTEEGRCFLKSIGIDPDLIRISVGTESAEAIIAVFEQAFETR